MNQFPITKEGYDKLVEEYEHLAKVKLPDASKRIAEAMAHGDLKENAEYHAALEYQRHIQNRIEYLRQRITGSQIITSDPSGSEHVIFGSCVTVLDLEDNSEEQFTLVGEAEANPREGRISTTSPIGKSLLGKKPDDIVEVTTPGGVVKLKILSFT